MADLDVKVTGGDYIELVLTESEKDTLMSVAKEAEEKGGNGAQAAFWYLLQLERYTKVLNELKNPTSPSIIFSPVVVTPGYFTAYVSAGDLKVTTSEKKKEKKPRKKKNKSESTQPSSFTDLVESSTVNSVEDTKNETINNTAQVTENLSKKVESISKTLSSARIKKLFQNATPINKFVEKLKDENKVNQKDRKETKIDELKSDSDGMVDMLTKILTFMQKNYEEDKTALEEAKNFSEENEMEKSKRQKELLDALKAKGKGGETPTTEKEEEESLLDKFGGLGSTLLNIAKFFTMNPVGLAIIGATSLMVLLGRDKDPEATNQGIQNAGKADGGMAEAITNIEGSDRRRSKILRAAYESGELKQQGAWYSFSGRKKEAEQEKKYLEALGFDPKTGLTQADRDKGFNFVDPDTGEASYSKFFDKEGKPKSKEQMEQDKKDEGNSSPAPAAETKQDSGGAPSPSAESPAAASVPASASPASESTPNLGSKLSEVTGENIDTKMIDDILPQAQNMLNSVSSTMNNVTQPSNNKVPHVRNQEETFQRLIYINTRVV